MGNDISEAMLRVLNTNEPLKTWNSTEVTLIPKVKNPNLVKDFRPISLCNVSYKIVARTITNGLKIAVGDIIDPHQSAFVTGRSIMDNILLKTPLANKVLQLSS